jgi:hypothetical protein
MLHHLERLLQHPPHAAALLEAPLESPLVLRLQRMQYLKFSSRLYSVSSATDSSKVSACSCIRRVPRRYVRILQHRARQRPVPACLGHLDLHVHNHTLPGEVVPRPGLRTEQTEHRQPRNPHRLLLIYRSEQRREERARHAESDVAGPVRVLTQLGRHLPLHQAHASGAAWLYTVPVYTHRMRAACRRRKSSQTS